MVHLFKHKSKSTSPSPGGEDVLQQLKNYNVVVLMDNSLSMRGTRWTQAGKVMTGVVEKAIQYDKDGIEIYFLNGKEKGTTVQSKEAVEELFRTVQPHGWTPLGERLDKICGDYLGALGENPELKSCVIVVITDGVPNSEAKVKDTIKSTANQLRALRQPLAKLGIQFVQIGRETDATKFLNRLDNDLKNEGDLDRDMVDTVPYSGEDLTTGDLVKILAGAINRKLDGK